ncbi:metallophosphoesterase [Streptomyces sp. NPDC057939]|uniref:metallophosphoesterase n=1 Tax=Streptomyces sp. NPDC057939 TaxID=3346284 RepID=UPI0036ED96B5
MTVFVFVLIVLAVLALLAAVHRWLWVRLVRDTTRPGSAVRRAGTVAAFVLPVLAVAALTAGRAGAPFWLQRLVAWPGFMWLAVLLYLTLSMLVAEVVRRVWLRRPARTAAPAAPVASPQDPEPLVREEAATGTGAGAGTGTGSGPGDTGAAGSGPGDVATAPAQVAGGAPGEGPDGVTRRLFVSRALGGAALVATAATVGTGTYGVLRGPRVKRVQVPLARLPRAAHGFRIAVVSDVHLGAVLGRAHAQRIVDTVNRTQPDLIAIVGDLVDGDVADLGPAAEPLRGLTSRHGTFFVTGNHEYFSGAQQWVDHVRELGLNPLENARRELPYFDLAGVNDIAGETEGQGPDFVAALGDRDRSRTSVLLAHQPIVIDDAVRHGVDLQLSGHTHGGQLWPGKYLAELANPTVAGLERYGDTQLYVSRGAGAWGPPVRVGAPSDITVVELASYQA